MPAPTRTSALRNTVGGAFTTQTIGGVVMGVANSGALTGSLTLLEAATLNDGLNADSGPRLLTSGVYTTKKPLSSGTFAYNAAKAGTWVISRITETLSGVSNTNMLFMASNFKNPIANFNHDFGVGMLTAWRNQRFSWTGRLANGDPIASRVLWMNADGTAVSNPGSLGGIFMWDLTDGNATDKAVDDAANPTRAIPGELVLRSDFVTAGLGGGNFFDYKPITGI